MNSGLPSLRRCIRRASLLGKLMAGKPHREKLRHGFFGQVLERQFLTEAVRLQLPLDALQRMLAEDDVDRPIRADHHQPCGVAAPGEVADQIERRVVAPVQILEHDDERRLDGDRVHRLGHLAQHAFAGGRRDLAVGAPRDRRRGAAMAARAARRARVVAATRRCVARPAFDQAATDPSSTGR